MRALIGTIVVLALLVVGADIGARLFAQNQAEKALREHYPAAADPNVQIHGFSFLLQAFKGDYSHIEMSSQNVTLGALTNVQMHVDLHDVQLPLSDAIGGDVSDLVARRADFQAVIPATSLGDALDQQNLTVTPTADGLVQIGTTVTIAGQTIPVTVAASASITDGSLALTAKLISAAGMTLPPNVTQALQARLSVKLPLSALPFSIKAAGVSAQDGALVVTATGTNITAQELGLTGGAGDAKGATGTTSPKTTTTSPTR
jgi:hypothetical protein